MLKLAPYHPIFHYQIARLSALSGDSTRALSALEKALVLGLDFGEKLDEALEALHPEAKSDTIKALIEGMRRPGGNSRVAFTIAERDLTPEGIAYDPKSEAFYLGSTWKQKIVRVDREGRRTDFTSEKQDGLRSVLGLRIDAARRTLWANSVVTAMPPNNDPKEVGQSALFRYNLDTGRLMGKYEAPDKGIKHLFNDLAVSSQGDVFITDTEAGAVYAWRHDRQALELLVASDDFIRPNGITMGADDKILYVSCTDCVYRLDATGKSARRLAQPDDVCLGGIDGLYWTEGRLVGVQNGNELNRIIQIDLNRGGDAVERMKVLENRNPLFELPTTGALAGRSFFYMANTQIDATDKEGKLLPVEKLKDVIVLRLELDAPGSYLSAKANVVK